MWSLSVGSAAPEKSTVFIYFYLDIHVNIYMLIHI